MACLFPPSVSDRSASTSHRCLGPRGFTLIEIVVSMAVASVMVVGLMSVWISLNDHFLRVQWRQQAVIVAHAQLERLAALGRFTDFFADEATHADGGNKLGRWIYRANLAAFANPVVVVENTPGAVTKTDFSARQIVHVDSDGGTNGDTEFNVVWLDRDSNVTGLLKWTVDEQLSNCSGSGGGSDCYRITLRLEYPFRFVEGTGPAEDTMSRSSVLDVVELKTVVGYRL